MPNKATLIVYNESGNPHGWAPVEINGRKFQAKPNGEIELTIEQCRTITHLVVNWKGFTQILVNMKEEKLPLILIVGASIQVYVSKILDPQETPPTLPAN